MVIYDIYVFLAAFREHVGKSLKWNSVWKRIKRAGFELNTAHPKKTSTRHYLCLVPQTGLEEMAVLATQVRETTLKHVGSKRDHVPPELSEAIHQEMRESLCKKSPSGLKKRKVFDNSSSEESTDMSPRTSSDVIPMDIDQDDAQRVAQLVQGLGM